MIVANLWNKNLMVGDTILDIKEVDSRYGPLRSYTVERKLEDHERGLIEQAERREAERAKLEDEEADRIARQQERMAARQQEQQENQARRERRHPRLSYQSKRQHERRKLVNRAELGWDGHAWVMTADALAALNAFDEETTRTIFEFRTKEAEQES